jgi:hypothetical protein
MDVKITNLALPANATKERLDELMSVDPSFTPAPKEIYDITFVNDSDYNVLIQSVAAAGTPANDNGILLTPGQSQPIDRFTTRFVFISAPDLGDVIPDPAPAVRMIFKIV